MRRRALLHLLLALGLVVGTAPVASAAPSAVVDVSAPSSVAQGERWEMTITASDVTDLFAYDLQLTMDAESLVLVSSEVTGPEGGFTSSTATDSGYVVTHTRRGTSPGLDGDQTLARLVFEARGEGTVPVDLSSVQLVGADGATLDLDDVADLEVDIEARAATPTPTPTPDPENTGGSSAGGPGGASGDADGLAGLLPNAGTSITLALLVLAAVMVAAGLWLRRRTGAEA
ncbi:cohesin domain-containing protein [Aeromicrobium halocynthiae]